MEHPPDGTGMEKCLGLALRKGAAAGQAKPTETRLPPRREPSSIIFQYVKDHSTSRSALSYTNQTRRGTLGLLKYSGPPLPPKNQGIIWGHQVEILLRHLQQYICCGCCWFRKSQSIKTISAELQIAESLSSSVFAGLPSDFPFCSSAKKNTYPKDRQRQPPLFVPPLFLSHQLSINHLHRILRLLRHAGLPLRSRTQSSLQAGSGPDLPDSRRPRRLLAHLPQPTFPPGRNRRHDHRSANFSWHFLHFSKEKRQFSCTIQEKIVILQPQKIKLHNYG